MVATKILTLYESVWEPLLNNDLTGLDIIEFSRKLPRLRIALSCCVCGQLLINKQALCPTGCREHFACKACVGKKRQEHKRCKRCDDWNTYAVDDGLTAIIESYQNFCFYFLTSEHIVRVLEVKHEVDPKFNTFRLIDLVKEGLKGFPRLRKRKLKSPVAPVPSLPSQIKGVVPSQTKGVVVPLEVPKKSKQSKVGTNTIIINNKRCIEVDQIQHQPIRNDKDVKKHSVRKVSSNDGPQEKPVKSKGKSGSDEPPIAKKVQTPKSAPARPSLSYTKNVIPKSYSSGSTSSFVTTTAKRVEPPKAASASPPLVTIKVEVQTTPEKSHSPYNGDESSNSSASLSAPDSMPLQVDPLIDVSRSPPKLVPTSTLSRPPPFPATVTFTSNPSTSGNVAGPSYSYKITTQQPPIVSSQPSMAPHIIRIAHPSGGIRTVSIRPQQIRLAGLQGSIPVQIIGASPAVSGSSVAGDGIRAPIITNAQTGPPQTSGAAPTVKRRIIFTTATPHDLQKWPDTNKVIQFATGDLNRFPALAGIRSGVISVGQSSVPMVGIRTSTPNVRPVASATIPLVRPPSTHTVLSTSSSSMGHPIFTSNSNQQGTMANAPGLPFVRSVTPLGAATSGPIGTLVQSQPQTFTVSSSAAPVTHQVPDSSPSTTTTNSSLPVKRKSEGCRCGNAAPTPGKLTCIGQRCACYADRSACSDCKCKGCKNPYLPGSAGHKLLHGVRALIDPQTNQAIPIIATPLNHAPTSSTLISAAPTVSVAQAQTPFVSVGPNSFGTIQTGMSSSMSQPVQPFQFIPVRFGPNGAPQYLQIANPQALQQMPLILSTSGHMHGNSSTGITIQGIPVSGFSAHQVAQIQQQQQQQRAAQMNMKTDGRLLQE